MVLDEKKEALLFVGAILILLVVGSLGFSGNLIKANSYSSDYYCHESAGLSLLNRGTVTYSNTGTTGKKVTDFCVEEGKIGGLVHKYSCTGRTLIEDNFACSYKQKCLQGRCVDIS